MAEALIEESSCRSFFCRKDAYGTLFIREQLVAAEVERYYRKAKEILAQNQDFLEKMASALVDRGLLLAPDIQEVKNNGHIIPYTLREIQSGRKM